MSKTFPSHELEDGTPPLTPKKYSCNECRNGLDLPFSFTMAFQPIVDIRNGSTYSQEALVRGINQETAGWILSQVNDQNRYKFDQACRVKAIELASRLKITSFLNINFLPNAVYRAETCIRTTLEASKMFKFPANQIIFEITEGEKVEDHAHVTAIFTEYKAQGFKTAIDDFGAGYSGLNLLAKFHPDIIKLDMELIRNIHTNHVGKAIVRSIVSVCKELNIEIIAEGIETTDELNCLKDMGIYLFQGYLFAKPAWEALADVNRTYF